MNIWEMWCISCRKPHAPNDECQPCNCTGEPFPQGLHKPVTDDAYLDHRGWRFFFPFYCFYCGDPICTYQFAFSRSCGGCDTSHSTKHRFGILERRIFAGRHERLDTNEDSDINPEFVDALTREDYPRKGQRIAYTPPRDNRRRPERSSGRRGTSRFDRAEDRL